MAPRVANSAQPGQFIIIIADEEGERVPLTICDYDKEEGTVNIVVQPMGCSTKKIAALKEGDYIKDFVGPLGRPSDFVNEDIEELKKRKDFICSRWSWNSPPVYPQARWFHEHGIGVDVVLGAKTKDLVILEDKLRAVSENLYVCTDDGSYGFSGMVTA